MSLQQLQEKNKILVNRRQQQKTITKKKNNYKNKIFQRMVMMYKINKLQK